MELHGLLYLYILFTMRNIYFLVAVWSEERFNAGPVLKPGWPGERDYMEEFSARLASIPTSRYQDLG